MYVLGPIAARMRRGAISGAFHETTLPVTMLLLGVDLCVPQVSSFPIQHKYIDVVRQTNANPDNIEERSVDVSWNIDMIRTLSEGWIAFTKFKILSRTS